MPEDGNLAKVRNIDVPQAMIYCVNKPQLSKHRTQGNHVNNRTSRVTGSMKNEQKFNLPKIMLPRTDKTHPTLTKTQIRPLDKRVLRFVTYKEKGLKLLMFLKRNNVLMNDVGDWGGVLSK